jgi:hypothetical protein
MDHCNRRKRSSWLSLLDDGLHVTQTGITDLTDAVRCMKEGVRKQKNTGKIKRRATAAQMNALRSELSKRRPHEEVSALEEYLVEAYKYIRHQSLVVDRLRRDLESSQAQTGILQRMVDNGGI